MVTTVVTGTQVEVAGVVGTVEPEPLLVRPEVVPLGVVVDSVDDKKGPVSG